MKDGGTAVEERRLHLDGDCAGCIPTAGLALGLLRLGEQRAGRCRHLRACGSDAKFGGRFPRISGYSPDPAEARLLLDRGADAADARELANSCSNPNPAGARSPFDLGSLATA